jgi:hypothetical protein
MLARSSALEASERSIAASIVFERPNFGGVKSERRHDSAQVASGFGEESYRIGG